MKKSRLNDWLSALRSDNYTKCRGALHRNDGFCPLGILCDISKLDSWKEPSYFKTDKRLYFGQFNYLPVQVREWAGISEEEYGSMTAFVMVMNDYEQIGLKEMADILEARYKIKQ
jgi:hypothetical protein